MSAAVIADILRKAGIVPPIPPTAQQPRAVTPVTEVSRNDVTAAAQQPRAVTPVTAVTAQNNKAQQPAQQPAPKPTTAAARPVFTFVLTENPLQPYIMLGIVGQTVAEARASLYDRYGTRLLSVADYVYPPPERVQ